MFAGRGLNQDLKIPWQIEEHEGRCQFLVVYSFCNTFFKNQTFLTKSSLENKPDLNLNMYKQYITYKHVHATVLDHWSTPVDLVLTCLTAECYKAYVHYVYGLTSPFKTTESWL